MMRKFDVFIIGSGMAGMTVAHKCASKGLSVGITDELPYGGTCALRGCDPKKVLIGATEVTDFARRLQGKGIDQVPSVNWADLMKFKDSFVDPMPPSIEKSYKKKGIACFHSPARFINKNQLKVGNETIEAEKIVISAGAKARNLSVPGKEHALTSTDFLNLKQLPDSLLFIGGGYIAFEFSHIAARCGAKVTIVHRGSSPLKNFEPDIVSHLMMATEALGINLVLETEVTEIRKKDSQFTVTGTHNDQTTEYSATAVFNSAGRVAAIFNLDLEKANVEYSEKGVMVNEHLQSVSNPRIYAAGDSADTEGLPLTPVAVMEGHIAASNIINGNRKKVNYPPMPTVVFTQPVMASVGLTEKEAKEKNLSFKVNYQSVSGWFNAKRLNADEYAYKTLIDRQNGTLLGAHLIGPHAEETINLFAMAMKAEMKASDIKNMMFSYPTLASDISHMI